MRRTKPDAEKTRDAILAAAECLFLQRGVAHTSLEQIARQAGVTRGAVYWHFKNKADLFHAMLNQVRLPAELIASQIRQCDPENPLIGLRSICIHTLSALLHDERKRRIFFILKRRCEFTAELKEAELQHEAFINEVIEMVTGLFATPEVSRQLRPGITAQIAARTFHFMFTGMLGEWLRDPQLFDIRNSEAYFDTVLHGLLLQWQPPASSSCPPAQFGS